MPLESCKLQCFTCGQKKILSLLVTQDGNIEIVAMALYLHPLHCCSHFSPAPLNEVRIPMVSGGHSIFVKVFQQDLTLLIGEYHSSCLCVFLGEVHG